MLALPPGLDPDLLRSFVLIAEGGSFTRAAQAVGRTQSAVSMQIRRLEEVLGQPLLLRGTRGVETTIYALALTRQVAGTAIAAVSAVVTRSASDSVIDG